jgi:hypothetical protein
MTSEQECWPYPNDTMEAKLERLEKLYRSGHLGAATEAIDHCWLWHQQGVPVPPPIWLLDAVAELGRNQILSTKRIGRTGNYLAEQRQGQIHYVRWAVVLHLRKNCPDRKLTWEKAYSAASRELRGTPAQGSARQMKKSYLRTLADPWICPPPDRRQERARQVYEARDSYLKPLGPS